MLGAPPAMYLFLSQGWEATNLATRKLADSPVVSVPDSEEIPASLQVGSHHCQRGDGGRLGAQDARP
jgi:hypothetical protein